MRNASRSKVSTWTVIGWMALLLCAGGVAWAQSPGDGAGAGAGAGGGAKAGADAGSLYDPQADPAQQLAAAIGEATSSGRRIVLEVGGDWCVWCHHLHDFFASHDGVQKLWDESFVTVDVNVSQDNRNEAFLSHYPEIPGYPHFFVLSSKGELLHSQSTGDLEEGESYSKAAMLDFISQWAPPDLRP